MKIINLNIIILEILMIMSIISNVSAATIEITDARATAEYWTSRNVNGDRILMSYQQINRLNAQMMSKDTYGADLSQYPEIAAAEKVNAAIREAESKFLNKSHFVYSDIKVRYAVTTQRGNIRLLPQNWNGDKYDSLQGTAIDPAEAVAVLVDSADGRFVFVQSRNYIGWLDKSILAFTDRQTWLTYVQPTNFLVVISNKRSINVGGIDILFQMGSIIPLNRQNQMRLPISVNGQLKEINMPFIYDSTIHHGFLPCTENNFIRQAFKFLGDVYGWGGLDNSVDCSAFVEDVYRSMGINLPRDADRQEAVMPIWAVFNNVTTDERFDIVRRAPIGSLLFKPGHVMMKIGVDDNGNPLVIHAASSYFSGGVKHYIRKVLVSDLYYQNGYGVETINGLSGIGFAK